MKNSSMIYSVPFSGSLNNRDSLALERPQRLTMFNPNLLAPNPTPLDRDKALPQEGRTSTRLQKGVKGTGPMTGRHTQMGVDVGGEKRDTSQSQAERDYSMLLKVPGKRPPTTKPQPALVHKLIYTKV